MVYLQTFGSVWGKCWSEMSGKLKIQCCWWSSLPFWMAIEMAMIFRTSNSVELRCCQYWLWVGTGCEWGIVQLTIPTGLEKSPDVICSQCFHMFSQWPNVFNHLMGNHWYFLERSLRHGNLRDDLSNKAHSTNEELEIYHHHGTKYLEISTNMALKKTTSSHHIQYHPILPKGGLLMLFAYEHLYITIYPEP